MGGARFITLQSRGALISVHSGTLDDSDGTLQDFLCISTSLSCALHMECLQLKGFLAREGVDTVRDLWGSFSGTWRWTPQRPQPTPVSPFFLEFWDRLKWDVFIPWEYLSLYSLGCVHFLGCIYPFIPWEYSSLYSLGCVRSLGCIYPFIPREYLSLYSSGCIYPFIPRDAFIPLFLGNIFPLFFGNINPFIPWDAFIPVAHGVSAQDHFPGSGTAAGSAPGRAAQSRGSPWAPGWLERQGSAGGIQVGWADNSWVCAQSCGRGINHIIVEERTSNQGREALH